MAENIEDHAGAITGLAGNISRRPLADFRADPRLLMLVGMAVVIGTGGALAAWVLVKLIALVTNLVWFGALDTTVRSMGAARRGPWMVAAPVLGGLVIGLMARFGSEKIRGHGIPEAIEAILIGGSRMSPKVAVLKPISSAISIGTGGPFGAEGPIIMTGGAIGSLFAQFFHLSAAERKTLLVAGAAAGMTGDLRHARRGGPAGGRVAAFRVAAAQLHPRRCGRARGELLAAAAVRRRAAVSLRRCRPRGAVGHARLRRDRHPGRPALHGC